MIGPSILLFTIFAAPTAIILFIGLGARDWYKDRKRQRQVRGVLRK